MSSNLIVNNIEVGAGATIYTAASNQLAFGTNGAERVRIASDGDLTITGSDNAELKLKCGTSSGNNIIAFLNSSGATKGNIFYDSDHNFMVFKTNGTASSNERLRITSDGKIGINQANPTTALLEIFNSGSAVQGLDVYTNDVAATPIAKFRGYDNTLGVQDRATIQANGKIGIGTGTVTDSNVGVEIVGGINTKTRIQFDNKPIKTADNDELGGFIVRNNADSVGYIFCRRDTANDAAYLIFGTQATGGSVAERLRITSDGVIQTPGTTKIKPHSVGIGTTSITNTGVGTAYGEMMYNTTTNNIQVYTTTTGWYNVSDLQGYYKTAADASSDGMNHYWGGSGSTSIISGLTPNGSPGGSPSAPGVNLTTQSYYGDYPYFDFASGNSELGWEFTKSGTNWGAGPFTIVFWVDLQGVTLESESTFVQIGNHSGSRSMYSVSADADRKLKAITIGDDTGVSTDAQMIGNTWQHVAVTYNTSRVTKYYINGSLVRSHTHNSAMQIGHSAQHIYLGYGYWNSSAGNKASISHMSDIGIWDAKELNATEIKNIYNAKRIIRGY